MFVQKIIRYFTESLVICIVALYIPKINLDLKEILKISLTGTFTLMIIDLYAPDIGIYLRQGLGGVISFKNINGTQLKGGNFIKNNLKLMTSKIDELEDKAKNLVGLKGGNNYNKKIIKNNNKNVENYINILKKSI